MHAFAVALIPHYEVHAALRPLEARDAAVRARLEMLLYRYEQPEDQAWGVDYGQGFRFDWWQIGGHWNGWEECAEWPGFGKLTARERKAKAAWLRRIRKLMRAYPHCLAVGIDYHS